MCRRDGDSSPSDLQDNFGYDLPAVEAAKKKHDAIETDIAAYEERVQSLVDISKELEAERYHDAKRIDVRKDNVLRLWDYLQELLKARRGRLHKNVTLQRIFQEMLHIISWMDDMKVANARVEGTSGEPSSAGLTGSARFFFFCASPGSAAVARLWEAPAGGGGPAAEARPAGERHRAAGGARAGRRRRCPAVRRWRQ